MTTSTPQKNFTATIAVASDKFKKGGKASLLWKPIPGSPPEFRVEPLADAMEYGYPTDAHFVTYIVTKEGRAVLHQPRLRKEELAAVRAHGFDIRHDVNVADVDTIGHASLTPEQIIDARSKLAHLETIGWFTTRGGLRVLQPRTNPCGPEEYEAGLASWLTMLQDALGPSWDVDRKCQDWTRLFRLPHVRRDGQHTEPTVDFARMTAITFPRVTIAPVAPPKVPSMPAASSSSSLQSRRDRARSYVARITPPPCGTGQCQKALFNTALHVSGFSIDEGAAVNIVGAWASRSDHAPAFTLKEIERVVRNAFKAKSGFHVTDDKDDHEPLMTGDADGMAVEEHDAGSANTPRAVGGLAGDQRSSVPPKSSKTPTWKDQLLYRKGKLGKTVKSCSANVETFLRLHPEWVGRIGYDEFRQMLVWLDCPPPSWCARYPDSDSTKRGAAWSDGDTTRLLGTLNREGNIPTRVVSTLKLGDGSDGKLSAKEFHEAVREALGFHEANVLAPWMPIQDAIDLAHFLADTAAKYSRFTPGYQTVGGPIDIAAITKHEGFKWARRKHYYDSALNPRQ